MINMNNEKPSSVTVSHKYVHLSEDIPWTCAQLVQVIAIRQRMPKCASLRTTFHYLTVTTSPYHGCFFRAFNFPHSEEGNFFVPLYGLAGLISLRGMIRSNIAKP